MCVCVCVCVRACVCLMLGGRRSLLSVGSPRLAARLSGSTLQFLQAMAQVPNFKGFKFTDTNFYVFQQLMYLGQGRSSRVPSPATLCGPRHRHCCEPTLPLPGRSTFHL